MKLLVEEDRAGGRVHGEQPVDRTAQVEDVVEEIDDVGRARRFSRGCGELLRAGLAVESLNSIVDHLKVQR